MWRFTLVVVGGVTIAIAAYIWLATRHWYDAVPGVQITGPLNIHFARDVALAYLVSGIALIRGGLRLDRSVALFGAAWPLCHALFHAWIWMGRGTPFDTIALTNLGGIQIPAIAGFVAATRIGKREAR